MTPEEFVKAFFNLKEEYKSDILNLGNLQSKELFEKLNLNTNQNEVFKEFIDTAFTDLLYTILLSFDGASSFSNKTDQQEFKIFDGDGNKICNGDGEIEALAYEYFHNN